MKTFKVVQTDGVNGYFVNPAWVKEVYQDANEAANDFVKLVKEVETQHRYVSQVRKAENWREEYEPKQSETFQVELINLIDEEITDFKGDEFNDKTAEMLKSKGFEIDGWIVSDEFYNA